MRLIKKISTAAIGGIAAMGIAASVATAGPIEDRQQAMKDVGSAMKLLAGFAKGEMEFDANMTRLLAIALGAQLSSSKGMFGDDSKEGPPETWAKAEVWSDRAGFDEAMDAAIKAAGDAAAVTESGKLLPALKALGGTCGTCHKKYRRPK